MVAHVSGECMKLSLVPLVAVSLGGISALAAAALPAAVLDQLLASGDCLATLWSSASHAVPLSRPVAVLAIGAIGTGAGALTAQLFRPDLRLPEPELGLESRMVPIIRRVDAHSDASPPPRATQAPDLSAEAAPEPVSEAWSIAERDLPADLDQPLAAFDPQAIPPVPLPPPVPPRRSKGASAALRNPAGRDPVDRLVRPETDATVHALLERLERGVVRRGQAAQVRARARPDRGLDDALATLRNLARQA